MSRLEELKKLAEASPDDPLAHYAVGLEYFAQERYPEAIVAFERALRVDPQYIAAYYHRARAEIRAGENAAAQGTLKAGIEVARRAGDSKTTREMQELLDTIS